MFEAVELRSATPQPELADTESDTRSDTESDTKRWSHGRSQRGGTHPGAGREGVGPAHRLADVRGVERDPHQLPRGRPRDPRGGRHLPGEHEADGLPRGGRVDG